MDLASTSHIIECENFNDTRNCVIKINNFSKLNLDLGEYVDSAEFNMKNNVNIKWCVRIYPSGIMTSDYIALYLIKKSLNEKIVEADFNLSFLFDNRSIWNEKQFTNSFTNDSYSCGSAKFIKKDLFLDNKIKLIIEDSISIACSVTIKNSTETKIIEIKNTNTLEKLYLEKIYADLSFGIAGKEIKAHKAILFVECPELLKLFEDKKTSVLFIQDMSFDIMDEILRFIYTKKVKNLKNIAQDLIFAADKYKIRALKTVCENSLVQNIAVHNVFKLAEISQNLTDLNLLIKATLEFIIENKRELINHPYYSTFIQSHPNI